MLYPARSRAFGLIAGAAGLLAAATAVAAQPRGEHSTVRWCAQCHGVLPDQVSPNPEAPPFALLAADPSITAYSLRVFLRTSHENMPNFILRPEQTDEVIDYILSLKNAR